MGRDRLERLMNVQAMLEDLYIKVTNMIKSEQLADALVVLANNEGVMLMLNEQEQQGDENVY
ncbi:hypothetical protein KAR91_65555 [Candidatus Pacearchaeota archaeon]|nr:hypothetical protein [Candidatus Pacearchaeota archaeon]